MDRVLAMARRIHDAELCASGAGPTHYRDECDEDSDSFADPVPVPVESTCVWLAAVQAHEEEMGRQDVRERGLMTAWRDDRISRAPGPARSVAPA